MRTRSPGVHPNPTHLGSSPKSLTTLTLNMKATLNWPFAVPRNVESVRVKHLLAVQISAVTKRIPPGGSVTINAGHSGILYCVTPWCGLGLVAVMEARDVPFSDLQPFTAAKMRKKKLLVVLSTVFWLFPIV